MATIIGSSTIGWSGISAAQVDFETDLVKFVNRVDQTDTEIGNNQFFIVSASPTFIGGDLVSGGRVSLGGSGFDTDSPIVNSFNFAPPDGTVDVLELTGVIDGDGKSDILWRNDNGCVAEWNMNGTTSRASSDGRDHVRGM